MGLMSTYTEDAIDNPKTYSSDAIVICPDGIQPLGQYPISFKLQAKDRHRFYIAVLRLVT
jgi:hypothetical protein